MIGRYRHSADLRNPLFIIVWQKSRPHGTRLNRAWTRALAFSTSIPKLPYDLCQLRFLRLFSSHSSVTVLITICLLVQEPQNCEKCDKVPLKESFAETAATDLNSDLFQSKSPSSGCLHFRSRKTAKAETFCELAHRSKIFSCVGKGIPTQKL